MAKRNLNDLVAFVTVAREGSFTRAGAVLGVSQSALSQAIKALEERLEIRLLTRTTRSVSATPAGERLLQAIGNRFDEIEAELDALTELREKPAGTVRLTSGDHVLRTLLLPKLLPVIHRYPDIRIEFDVSYGLRDIVADRFDAGVRLGESIDKDMIAMPISPKLRMAAVALQITGAIVAVVVAVRSFRSRFTSIVGEDSQSAGKMSHPGREMREGPGVTGRDVRTAGASAVQVQGVRPVARSIIG